MMKQTVISFHRRRTSTRSGPLKKLFNACVVILGMACVIALFPAALHGQTTNVGPNVAARATHLMGFAGAKPNAGGTLTVQGDRLLFSPSGKPAVSVPVLAIRDIFL
jgi:hypothetical protein